MAQRGKRSREGVSNIDETIDQVSGEKSSPPLSRGKRAPYTSIRLPARIAPLFFELTKTLGHKRDGKTVEWLIRESERDLDPHKFSSPDDLLINGPKDESMMTPPRKRREQRRQDVPRDRHRRTEDGRDRRVRVPYNCVSRLTDITRKLAGKSDGTTLEWLYKKYWLSGIRLQQAIPSTTTINSSPVSTDTNFNGAYFVPDVDSSVSARAFSIADHDHQQNPARNYEQEVFVEPTVNANPNSVQYEIAPSSHPYGLYFGDSANQLQCTSYPQQQSVIEPNLINTPSWMPNAGGGMAANDRLIMEGSRFEPHGQMSSLQNRPYSNFKHEYAGSSSATVREWLVEPTENLPYTEPHSTGFTSVPRNQYKGKMAGETLVGLAEEFTYIPQSCCPRNQYSLSYEGISTGTGEPAQYTSYPQQQAVIQGNSIKFSSWMPNAGGGMAADDRLIMEANRFEPPGQMVSLQNNTYSNFEHEYAGSSSAMAGECLFEPAGNLSYGAQYSIIKRDRNNSGIAINSEHVQQGPNIPHDNRYQGVGGNGLGEGPKIPQDHHRYIGRMRQPAHSIMNNSNNAISMNSPYPQQLCYQGVGGNALGEEPTITQHHQYLGGAS
jgi:hypothetical protein